MLSPMMQNYLQTKENYKDCLLFYRLGDFYELFFEDAETASRELDITLTGKDCGLENRAPMCGIPYHALEGYLARLISKGYKVAICEQLSEPTKKGLVERGVVRIVTPGTVIESNLLDEKRNNYLCSVYADKEGFALSYVDITTGEFLATSVSKKDYKTSLNDELMRISPSEIICNDYAYEFSNELAGVIVSQLPKFSRYYEMAFDKDNATRALLKQFNTQSLTMFDICSDNRAISACGALLQYVVETQKRELNNIRNVQLNKNNYYMFLDSTVRRNLELTSSIKEGRKNGTLLSTIDFTKTTMGARMLRSWVNAPLQNKEAIENRLNAVDELYGNVARKDALTKCLSEINDIERLAGRVAYGSVMPRDLLSLAISLRKLPQIKLLLEESGSKALKDCYEKLADFSQLEALLTNAISEDAPLVLKDGGYIKQGFNDELDELRSAKTEGKNWLAKLEAVEREQTGIKNLKIGFNKVFGYFIEVNKSQQELVPLRYVRKQTIANNERYITEELKEIENKVLGAEELSIKLEQKLFDEIKKVLNGFVDSLLEAAKSIATLDVFVSFATLALRRNYVKPKMISSTGTLEVIEGRHPVVEALLKDEQFVPNDVCLDNNENRTMIITGPNMAGKSTYMRQVALIVLMAHMGCFVPAKKATIPICDRIFTRIGASDDLAFGQSTFMVEMSEVSSILHNATNKSLIILDEVGRGTSTYDGLSIAWAIMEYVSSNLKARTLFATHYHELTELEGNLDGVKNYRISVKEFMDKVVFLRKIVRGGANRSFGIEVAEIAGIPKDVTDRAKQILSMLESADNRHITNLAARGDIQKVDNTEKVAKEIYNILKEVDINKMSPFMAIELVNDLCEKIKKGK